MEPVFLKNFKNGNSKFQKTMKKILGVDNDVFYLHAKLQLEIPSSIVCTKKIKSDNRSGEQYQISNHPNLSDFVIFV